eukprot:m.462353 g.462353  ORF g.462353 m.462353 type:complete len:469 (+) comp22612_c0_seq1:63-1469(+)
MAGASLAARSCLCRLRRGGVVAARVSAHGVNGRRGLISVSTEIRAELVSRTHCRLNSRGLWCSLSPLPAQFQPHRTQRAAHSPPAAQTGEASSADSTDTAGLSWESAYREAEELVGAMNTLAGTRNLLGEELASVGVYAQRLFDSGHPIIHKTKGLIFDVNNARQLRGLTILVLSKALNQTAGTDVISPKQRALAEITELILAANLLHEGVLEFDTEPSVHKDGAQDARGRGTLPESSKGLRFGNKIAILGGDFLLASACTSLSRLKNAEAVKLVSAGIAASTEGIGLTTGHAAACSSDAVLTLAEWRSAADLVSAALFSRCCQAAATLNGLSPDVQAAAGVFGARFAVAYQLKSEIDVWYQGQLGVTPAAVVLRSGPVVLAAEAATIGGALAEDLVKRSADTSLALSEAELAELAEFVDCYDGMSRAMSECAQQMDQAVAALANLPPSPALSVLNRLAVSLAEPRVE